MTTQMIKHNEKKLKRSVSDTYTKYFILLGICFVLVIFGLNGVNAVGTYPAVDPDMQLYYHFNNNSLIGENDTFVVDSSLASNNGTANNTVFVPNSGILGDGSLSFSGANSTVLPINQTFLSFNSTNNSLSIWIYPITNGTKYFFSSNAYTRFSFDIDTLARIHLTMGNPAATVTSANPISLNSWNNIIFTWGLINTTTSSGNLYINGVLARNINFTDVSTKPTKITIGSFNDKTQSFNGSIDEVIIWNKSLSSSDIWTIYNNYIECINLTGSIINVQQYTKICNQDINLSVSGLTISHNSYINFTGSHFSGSGGNFITLSGSNNITIDGLNFSGNDTYVIRSLSNSANINIINSYIDSGDSSFGWMLLDDTSNFTINNSIFGKRTTYQRYGGVYFRYSVSNVLIDNSLFYNCMAYGCVRFQNTRGINNILQNSIFNGNSSVLLHIANSTNIMAKNITFNDSNSNFDSYNVGVNIVRSLNSTVSQNITILNSRFTNIGCVGILAQGVDGLNISSNIFIYNPQGAKSQNANCAYESPTAIELVPIWKTWTSDSDERVDDNTNDISKYITNNIFINNNTYTNYPVILRSSGIATNLTQDISNYWFRSIQPVNYLFPRLDYYISNNFNNLTTTFNESNGNSVVLRDKLGVRYPGFSTSTPWIGFNIYNKYLYFINNNYTEGYGGYYNPYNSLWSNSLFNLTTPSFYNGTLSSGSILTNTNANLTLAPLDSIYVGTP